MQAMLTSCGAAHSLTKLAQLPSSPASVPLAALGGRLSAFQLSRIDPLLFCAPTFTLTSAACQIPYEDLEMQDQIGGGGFSLVYRGLWKGTPVAVKKWFDPNATDQLMQEFR